MSPKAQQPDFKGFKVMSNGKADLTKSISAIWFNDEDTKPIKPFTVVSEGSPKKMRFFSQEQLAEMDQRRKEWNIDQEAKEVDKFFGDVDITTL